MTISRSTNAPDHGRQLAQPTFTSRNPEKTTAAREQLQQRKSSRERALTISRPCLPGLASQLSWRSWVPYSQLVDGRHISHARVSRVRRAHGALADGLPHWTLEAPDGVERTAVEHGQLHQLPTLRTRLVGIIHATVRAEVFPAGQRSCLLRACRWHYEPTRGTANGATHEKHQTDTDPAKLGHEKHLHLGAVAALLSEWKPSPAPSNLVVARIRDNERARTPEDAAARAHLAVLVALLGEQDVRVLALLANRLLATRD